ncbi:MAG: hypothetical protein HY393_01895 [Candidatus Diapherotrites archaeon]|nr:hypothetical protein [Candidatus Diapherotrites archaeon]
MQMPRLLRSRVIGQLERMGLAEKKVFRKLRLTQHGRKTLALKRLEAIKKGSANPLSAFNSRRMLQTVEKIETIVQSGEGLERLPHLMVDTYKDRVRIGQELVLKWEYYLKLARQGFKARARKYGLDLPVLSQAELIGLELGLRNLREYVLVSKRTLGRFLNVQADFDRGFFNARDLHKLRSILMESPNLYFSPINPLE